MKDKIAPDCWWSWRRPGDLGRGIPSSSSSLDKTVSHLVTAPALSVKCKDSFQFHSLGKLNPFFSNLRHTSYETFSTLMKSKYIWKPYGGISSIFFEVYFCMTGNNQWQMALDNGGTNGFMKVEPASFFSPVCQNEKHARVFLQKVKLLSPYTLCLFYILNTPVLCVCFIHTRQE